MNKVILMGRLTRNPDIYHLEGEKPLDIAHYTLAVGRRRPKAEEKADYISCVAFGERAKFAEKHLKKGTKIIVTGRLQTRTFKNREGRSVFVTEVYVEEQEFAESKSASQGKTAPAPTPTPAAIPSENPLKDGFLPLEGLEEELPFA